MTNKEIVSSFLQTVALQDPHEAYAKYVSLDFKHHNQYFKGDRSSLLEAMLEADKAAPNRKLRIFQIVEEGDKVVTYSQVSKDNMEIAVFHMFHLEQGKIVEMWDVGQVISPGSPNENGLF